MKRNHGHVSATPLFLQKKGRTAARQDGLLGTPVEGLTAKPVCDPESEDRPPRAIPDTTQRRLEGFCLNTPLSLSQAAQQETPTLGSKDQPGHIVHHQRQEQEPQQQEQDEQPHPEHASCKLWQHPPAEMGMPATQARHRLANISNLPPSPASAMAAAAQGSLQHPYSSCGAQPMSTGGTTGLVKRKQKHHAFFQPGVLSPPPSLLGSQHSARAAAAHGSAAVGVPAAAGAALRTPFPGHGLAGHQPSDTPGSCGCGGGGDDDDGGFVLFTSQSYMRQSQPAISPSFAAGLSAQPGDGQDEPNTTPSQDSREPRPCPSNGTSQATTTASASCDQQLQPLLSTAATTSGLDAGQQQADCHVHNPAGSSGMAATGSAVTAGGSITPGEGLGLLPPLGPLLEETTTPELEAIGMPASQECGSQQQLMLPTADGSGAAAAAAAGGGGGGGGGGRRQVAAGSSKGGRAAAAGGGSGSSGARGRGPGVVCEEVTNKQVLFPIFRPKSERKCVILVRHGESTYNKQDAHGKNWADPHIFDAPLTQRGRQQALAAQDKVQELLRRHGHMGAMLWISSPLTRALETMSLAAPQVEAVAAAQAAGGGARLAGEGREQRVCVLSLIAEHCATTGDVGRPASALRSAFPHLASPLAELEEQWWFNPCPDEYPNCALSRLFGKPESVDSMRRRVSEFSRWLRNRPEQVVVAFGHSTFWKYFSNSSRRMRNCEVMHMWW